MGANGSRAKGLLKTEEGRAYKTLFKVNIKGNVIVYLDQKNPKQSGKTPEESHTPNRIYASFLKNGKGIKEVSLMGSDGKKYLQIHTEEHHGIAPHYHIWENGKPIPGDNHLTPHMMKILKIVQYYGN
ncbi:MAG: hypothetical protein IJ204_08765 [Paludibacteraceae bacterium]|nr:hypothetical protein [Paludibacteraceae bacterium]